MSESRIALVVVSLAGVGIGAALYELYRRYTRETLASMSVFDRADRVHKLTSPCALVIDIPGNHSKDVQEALPNIRACTLAQLHLSGRYGRPRVEVRIDDTLAELRPVDRQLTIRGSPQFIAEAMAMVQSTVLSLPPSLLHRVVFVPRVVLGRIKGVSNSRLRETLEMFGGTDEEETSPLVIRIEERGRRNYSTCKKNDHVPIRVTGETSVVIECSAYLQAKAAEHFAKCGKKQSLHNYRDDVLNDGQAEEGDTDYDEGEEGCADD